MEWDINGDFQVYRLTLWTVYQKVLSSFHKAFQIVLSFNRLIQSSTADES